MRVEGKKILLITMLWFVPAILFAQDRVHPPAPDNVVMSTPPPPVGLPIDFGISALIAAGLGLGIHHLRNRK
jgi:hypothetical protein